MEKNITKKDYFTAIQALLDEVELSDHVTGDITSGMAIEFCEKELTALETKAQKAKERAAAKKNEPDALTEAILSVLRADKYQTIPEITVQVTELIPGTTNAQVTYRLSRVLVKEGLAENQEVTIPAAEGARARKVQGYKAVETESETEE